MPALTPSLVMDLESRMRFIQEREYLRLTSRLWWDKCTKIMTSGAKKEIVTWALNTAQLEDTGKGGNITFDDMVLIDTSYESKTAGKGLKLRRQQFEDLDGNGVQLAAEWSAQIGAQHAYWPQKKVVQLLKNGHLADSKSYDGVSYFHAAHPLNPEQLQIGTYGNLIPNVPIDESVTVDVAMGSLKKVFAHIASIKMPNGDDPRMLRPCGILANPLLFPRAVQLSNAKTIAQAVGASGGGSADVEAMITALGYGQPIMADEFSGYENDTTYFVICEQVTSSELGGLVYVDREAFSTRFYSGRAGGVGIDAILDRSDELEWHTSGRNIAGYGHPFTIFKCKAGA